MMTTIPKFTRNVECTSHSPCVDAMQDVALLQYCWSSAIVECGRRRVQRGFPAKQEAKLPDV